MASSTDPVTSSTVLCDSEREFILDGCRDDCRIDGRTRNEFRSYTIITSTRFDKDKKPQHNQQQQPLVLSNGSARLISAANGGCNSLHVLCSVKAEIVQPSLNRLNEGIVQLYVDGFTSASFGGSSTSIGSGNKRRKEEEIQSLLSKLILDHVVDKKALCIVPGQYVWKIHIDLYFLSASAGSILDSSSHVIRAALQNTFLPSVTAVNVASTTTNNINNNNNNAKNESSNRFDVVVDGDITSAVTPPGVHTAPIVVTVTIMKCKDLSISNGLAKQYVFIVDATAHEEACSYAQVRISLCVDDNTNDNNDNNEINENDSKKRQKNHQNTNNDTSKNSSSLKVTIYSIIKTGLGSLSNQLFTTCVTIATDAAYKAQNAHYLCASTNSSSSSSAIPMSSNVHHSFLQEQFAIQ